MKENSTLTYLGCALDETMPEEPMALRRKEASKKALQCSLTATFWLWVFYVLPSLSCKTWNICKLHKINAFTSA